MADKSELTEGTEVRWIDVTRKGNTIEMKVRRGKIKSINKDDTALVKEDDRVRSTRVKIKKLAVPLTEEQERDFFGEDDEESWEEEEEEAWGDDDEEEDVDFY